MKKSKEFLKKLAAITLCSIAALQNISADTVINFDQGTVSFDSENSQKATVISGGATREVTGIPDGVFYLYLLDENNFICCNPKLNTYDVLSTAPSTSTRIYDFGGGITFWRGNWTGYCYFIDNGNIISPVSEPTDSDNCQFQYHKSNGVSYTICYENGVFCYPEITNTYSQQININYPPAQENNTLNTYDVLSTAPSTSTRIYDFDGGITFWRNNWTGYCYFIDNGTIIVPVSVPTGSESCQFQYHKSNGVSYTICYENGVFCYPGITNTYSQQININYPPAQENNNLNNFNYNQLQVINSNESQNLFHQTQMPVTPFRNTLNARSSETTNISPTKKPETPSLSTLEMQKVPDMGERGSREGQTERIGVYDFPAGTRRITNFDVFKTIQPTNCLNHQGNPAEYNKIHNKSHLVVYTNQNGRRPCTVTYSDLGGILGWKLARAAVLAGYKVPLAQEIRAEWDIYANPKPNSDLERTLISQGLWIERMRLTAIPKGLKYDDGEEFTEIDKRIFCEIRTKGVPPEWKFLLL